MGSILGFSLIYVFLGMVGVAVVGAESIGSDNLYIFVGFILLWPLFTIKGAVWCVWKLTKFAGSNIDKLRFWWVIPKSIGKVFYLTGKFLLFGKQERQGDNENTADHFIF